MIYLYDSDRLYYKTPAQKCFAHRRVEPMKTRCHNLKITKLTHDDWLYEFQLVDGDDTWFCTRYHWALVLATPENLARVARAENLAKERDAVLASYRVAEASVQTARTIHLKEQNEDT